MQRCISESVKRAFRKSIRLSFSQIASKLMPRLTITLSDEEHQALKLLTLMERKKLVTVVQEAIHNHLKTKGAFHLEVRTRPELSDHP